jgi:hypothetical protein
MLKPLKEITAFNRPHFESNYENVSLLTDKKFITTKITQR